MDRILFKKQQRRKKFTCTTGVFYSSTVKRAAFTLAEVLITIGVIGIVAALTLPGLSGIKKNQHIQNFGMLIRYFPKHIFLPLGKTDLLKVGI